MSGNGYNTTNIGENAGKVWQTLATNGGRQLETIAQQSNLPAEQAYLALGWLARENKINFAPRGKYTYVELTKAEKDACAICTH
ncbi:MAG: winged helix-turn-helix domain-containing protein [Planctomycetes bacterium]|nr:winged helix-turn-helix domain-containing protein [Planctomycetota bacterium]